jgi:hypothetical protein
MTDKRKRQICKTRAGGVQIADKNGKIKTPTADDQGNVIKPDEGGKNVKATDTPKAITE